MLLTVAAMITVFFFDFSFDSVVGGPFDSAVGEPFDLAVGGPCDSIVGGPFSDSSSSKKMIIY